MKPGTALDYAMGDGRNSLYLAKLGWTVYGFDMSEVAVGIANRRAGELGLKINAETSTDTHYDFGKERFDLILFSWSMPLVDVQKIIDALKPGGIIVMEFGPGFVGRNGMLHLFDGLMIERYEITRAVSGFSDRRVTSDCSQVTNFVRQSSQGRTSRRAESIESWPACQARDVLGWSGDAL